MRTNGKPHLQRILFGCLSLALLALLALLWFVMAHHNKDFTQFDISKSEYLKDVSEPITLVKCISWSDGGSMGLSFRDSRQVLRAVCLENDLDGNKSLTFGKMTPNRYKEVTIGGSEERAFLGLLQRWLRRDLEAQEWFNRMERWSRSDKQASLFTGHETEEQRTKACAIGIMGRLLERN
ncbi:hypothetical protein [Singulisphaera acidiphila]|nr:hypothetical protein [Singulisphaera acidiphila]